MSVSPIFIGFTLLDALLLWVLVAAPRGWWSAKLAAIIVVVAFNFLVLHAQGTGDGYTLAGDPPPGKLIACNVVEPSDIYLWVVPEKGTSSTFGYKPRQQEPRAYRVPYTRTLHAGCQAAQKAGYAGVGVRGGAGRHSRLHFYQLPPSRLRPKQQEGS